MLDRRGADVGGRIGRRQQRRVADQSWVDVAAISRRRLGERSQVRRRRPVL